jgi:hypothetical protein
MPFFKNHHIISIKIYGVERWRRMEGENLIKLYVFALVLFAADIVVVLLGLIFLSIFCFYLVEKFF